MQPDGIEDQEILLNYIQYRVFELIFGITQYFNNLLTKTQ